MGDGTVEAEPRGGAMGRAQRRDGARRATGIPWLRAFVPVIVLTGAFALLAAVLRYGRGPVQDVSPGMWMGIALSLALGVALLGVVWVASHPAGGRRGDRSPWDLAIGTVRSFVETIWSLLW